MFTVTTAADDLALLTAAEARAAIKSESASDPVVTSLIRRVSAAITRACRVPAAGATPPTLRMETVQDLYRLKSQQRALILSRRPVVAVTSIVENDETLDTDEYQVDSAAGLLLRLSDDTEICWPCGKIVVAYRAGWETVPDDLKEMCCKLAVVFWSEAQRGDPNLKAVEIPGVISREYWVAPPSDTLIPQEIIDGLGPYMHHVIG